MRAPGSHSTLPLAELSSRLASRLIGCAFPAGLAEALAQAHGRGASLCAPLASGRRGVYAAKSASVRISLMALFLGRPEAKQSEQFIASELADALARRAGKPPARREAFGDGLNRGKNPIFLRLSNESLPEIWQEEARQAINARRVWSEAAAVVIPLCSIQEMISAALPWERLVLVPQPTLFPLLDDAQKSDCWIDAVGHSPLSALALLENRGLGGPERSELIQKLVALKSPGMSARVANPLFSLILRSQNGGELDQELMDALEAVGCAADTPGVDGLDAVEMARACAPNASSARSNGFSNAFERAIAPLEAASIRKTVNDARNGLTQDADSGLALKRSNRRL